jgi:hypothetical protein
MESTAPAQIVSRTSFGVHQIAARREFASIQFQRESQQYHANSRERWESFPAMSEKDPRNANSFA